MIDVPPPLGAAIPAADAVELHELLARYGHLIDERAFSRLGEVFIPECVYDASDFGVPVIHGLENLIDFMTAETRHPLAHHATNILLAPRGDGLGIASKGLGIGDGGRVSSVTYVDKAVHGPHGWRLSSRTAFLRR